MFGDKRILERLDRMLDDGINGTFEESDYDETQLSKLESGTKARPGAKENTGTCVGHITSDENAACEYPALHAAFAGAAA